MDFLHSPVLIVAAPLLSALVTALVGLYNKKLCYPVVLFAVSVAAYAAVVTLISVISNGTIHYHIGGWIPPFGIEMVIDHLNAFVMVIVTGSSFLNVIYSKKSIEREIADKSPQFYTLYLLLIAGLLGITITGDVFNLYVLLEISAIASYALIALGSGRALLASYNYLIMGTVGASFYLLGVGHLYIATGSLNMADLYTLLVPLYGSNTVFVAFILLMVGVWIKMALFPVHGWLPNAYSFAPTAVGSLIAPTMTKVSVYVMIRVMFSVFTPQFVFSNSLMQDAVVWCAVIAIFGGSLQAIAQRNFRKMLTYLIISEIGYMVGGVWLGNRMGISGAILHILNDAAMMLALFFVAGIVYSKMQNTDIVSFKGLFRKMPVTMAAFVLTALSMIGVPPTAGFFSKFYLILGAVEVGKWHFMIALIVSSLINVVLFFRIIETGYFQESHSEHSDSQHKTKIVESPIGMLIPLVAVAVGLVIIGLYSGDIVTNIIQHAIPSEIL